jgi:OmcA/MtrC family decaheme c-type cytochrome
MIHSIHMGDDLSSPFTIFGFGGTAHDFTEVRYPAPQQDCAQCHLPGTTDLPLPPEALSTLVVDADGETVVSETFPETASCISCHDTQLANEHATLNTNFATGAETCAVCHGPNAAFAVEQLHRFAP